MTRTISCDRPLTRPAAAIRLPVASKAMAAMKLSNPASSVMRESDTREPGLFRECRSQVVCRQENPSAWTRGRRPQNAAWDSRRPTARSARHQGGSRRRSTSLPDRKPRPSAGRPTHERQRPMLRHRPERHTAQILRRQPTPARIEHRTQRCGHGPPAEGDGRSVRRSHAVPQPQPLSLDRSRDPASGRIKCHCLDSLVTLHQRSSHPTWLCGRRHQTTRDAVHLCCRQLQSIWRLHRPRNSGPAHAAAVRCAVQRRRLPASTQTRRASPE